MPDDSQKLWSCVGSAGVVNLPDVGKILFNKSVAQLGPASPVVVHPVEPSALPGTQTITAIIRYGVVPVDGVYLPPNSSLGLALRLRYRGGAGHVLAKFIQVGIESGIENTLLTFDSGPPQPASNDFQTLNSPSNPLELDFVANAYYVELTLSLTEPRISRPPNYPPALSVVQLCFSPPVIP